VEASWSQLKIEQDTRREQEQLAEAYLVQVTPARMSPEKYGSRLTTNPDTPISCPCVIVVNRGHYSITDIQAELSTDGRSMLQYDKRQHFSALRHLPEDMTSAISDEPDVRLSTLTPMDGGLRFSHDAIAERNLFGSYPIVRWRDRWGQAWEHKLGTVRKVAVDEQWKP
jgi:hypothetical protein